MIDYENMPLEKLKKQRDQYESELESIYYWLEMKGGFEL